MDSRNDCAMPPASSLTDEPEPCLVREFAGVPCITHGSASFLKKARLSAVAAFSVALAGTTRSGRAKSGVDGEEARRLASLWKSAA